MHSPLRHGKLRVLVAAPAMALRVAAVPGLGRSPALDWMSRGACRPEDPELFFPVSLTGLAPLERISAAKAVCGRCPVGPSCLSHAVMTGQDGIWGGTTEAERRAMRRSAARRPGAPAGAP